MMDEIALKDKSKEEILAEAERRTKVAENIWAAIMKIYGPEGFTKVLNEMERKAQVTQF
jgi:hypothetical protein